MIIQELRIAIRTNQETALNHHIEITHNAQTIEIVDTNMLKTEHKYEIPIVSFQ